MPPIAVGSYFVAEPHPITAALETPGLGFEGDRLSIAARERTHVAAARLGAEPWRADPMIGSRGQSSRGSVARERIVLSLTVIRIPARLSLYHG